MKNDISNSYLSHFSTSLIKGIQLLETLIDSGEIGVSSLAKIRGINKSNAHRILSTFEFLSYVQKDPKTLKYKATLKVFQLGSRVLQGIGLKELVWPFLKELGSRFGETVNLAVLDGRQVVYIDKVESSAVLRMDLSVGRSVPAHCTALGKILLSGMNEQELEHYLTAAKIEKLTPFTISQKSKLTKHLSLVRKQGYAVDHQELSLGITCIAAPIRNHLGKVVAAISVAGPSTRMTDARLDEIKRPLLETALEISRKIGLMVESYSF